MSTSESNPGLKTDLAEANIGHDSCSHPISVFPSTPSTFQLRSASGKDYLVEQLEHHLSRLNLEDTSPDHVLSSSRDIPMDVCVPSGGRKPTSLPDGQHAVPMIFITSVDSVHAKPLPLSDRRPSITPLGPSNLVNHATNVSLTKYNEKTSTDDPFATQLHAVTYPLDYNLSFRVPPFPLTHSIPYAPETPTPMCCDHFGDCSGDLWDIWHPPLVSSRFTLPPFKFPPLSTDLFSDVDTGIPVSY